ncbi:hypothetical protein AgCh_029058 [Apium graveolens]
MGESSKKKRKIKKTEAWEKLMSSFTDDLWTEILLRLPIKSLLQFKSVCKSWFSIISSHRFAKSHLMTAAKDDQVVIIHLEPNVFVQDMDDSFSLLHLGSDFIYKNLKYPYSQGEYPSDYPSSTLIGSDCGIVCLSVDLSDWPVSNKCYDIYLWNPVTKHSKLIPHDGSPTGVLGFGFDHIDLDFKLVEVISDDLSANVYSSNKNDWLSIQPKPIDVPQNDVFDICFHGFLFAIGNNTGMMAFNLNKDLFICDINLPVTSFNDAQISINTRVSDINETIAVIFYNTDNGKIQLWTLNNEACLYGGGLKALWSKVLNIDVGLPLYSVEGLFNNFLVLLLNRDANNRLMLNTHAVIEPYDIAANGQLRSLLSIYEASASTLQTMKAQIVKVQLEAFEKFGTKLAYKSGGGRNSGMMAFDLNKDLFIWDVNLPVSSFNGAQSFIKTRVIDFKDTIVVTISNMDEGKIQLWTLDDEACLYGGEVNASWTKVLTVDVGVPLNIVGSLFNNVQLLLVDAKGDVYLYDLNKKVTLDVTVPSFLEPREFIKYVKSLFSLEGFKRIKWAASSSRLQDSSNCDAEVNC